MKIFADTSAWLALHDRNDKYHQEALTKSYQIKQQKLEIVTSDYILDESITIILFRVSHSSALLFGESILSSRIVNLINIDKAYLQKTIKCFKKFQDKRFSFTDCTSYVLMKDLKIQKAFTFDDHFRQMGFEIF